MSYRFFGINVLASCESCHYGKSASNKHQILCIKKGITDKNFSCKKYKYNPLRRVPTEQININLFSKKKFSKEDFEL